MTGRSRATLDWVEGGASPDARLRPGDGAAPPGRGGRPGGGGVPAPDQPRPGPAAPHPLHPRQHDAEPGRGLAERRADPDPAQREADRGLLPPGAGAPADRDGLPDRVHDDRWGSGLRDRGLSAGAARRVLVEAARDPELAGQARAAVEHGAQAAGGADHPRAQGRQGPRRAAGGVEGAGGAAGACARQVHRRARNRQAGIEGGRPEAGPGPMCGARRSWPPGRPG